LKVKKLFQAKETFPYSFFKLKASQEQLFQAKVLQAILLALSKPGHGCLAIHLGSIVSAVGFALPPLLNEIF